MLKVPHDYACKPIRKHYRFQFTAPVEININNRHYNGMLTDFSVSGCKISLNHEAFVELGAKVDVKINIFPEQESIISSTITNITKFKSEKIIGVFFNQQIPFDDRLQSAIFKYCYPDC
ncbi:PilZ domain-containing protein [Vibrio sp. DNF-1]|nr:PilZ domain-containing protein [Vibrio salinus]MCE0496029.1 PilZ domain-containing protein [Vibrio salinus]